ncbi:MULTISPECIES: 5-(carboxyamino)imidazole ribonucleotide synthase [Vagococcus]|uniref:N5-carboxyaminoimidazole ribonucleotide synthase n=1 Tax=Vagococcus fluvialis bH819 TaxID=1255619 RepID=A0A1X6WK83_9ENTE|nr:MULTISPECIES: 5-(carboxyamino)imidazole ribonucleotide synthase [Vagococcus]SLM84650.1 Phosphoribosylaminoimidazole carboxylase ATPase subunit [Vagococcus fluvialis bH819]HCM89886.1 5-(carboxyamino)imidazole ribonucleotide synthase [Vagococcus sp.]
MTKIILPQQTIGIIGGGQLGQMMALSAKEMGFVVGILDPTTNCPASQVADWHIKAAYDDSKAIEKLVAKSDVVTYEFENVDAEVLVKCTELGKLPQGLELLKISQNRKHEKSFLSQLNLPTAPYEIINNQDELKNGIDSLGYPSVLKTCSGGYDGKGQVVIKHEKDIKSATSLLHFGECVLEKWLTFEKEISVIVSGSSHSQFEVFPIAENRHQNNVLHTSLIPADILEDCESQAKKMAKKIAKNLQIKGTITVEMFVTKNGGLIINEMAPRPHNSGHYSIEACNVSQFDSHIRGICGWPLPKVILHQSSIMMNLLGEEANRAKEWINQKPEWNFHYYGKKEVKDGRKMGHITILSNSLERTLEEINQTNIWK